MADRLGKTTRQVESEMDANDFIEWIAYLDLQETDYFNSIKNSVELTPEKESGQMRAFFNAIKPHTTD